MRLACNHQRVHPDHQRWYLSSLARQLEYAPDLALTRQVEAQSRLASKENDRYSSPRVVRCPPACKGMATLAEVAAANGFTIEDVQYQVAHWNDNKGPLVIIVATILIVCASVAVILRLITIKAVIKMSWQTTMRSSWSW